ncbi:MAG TPA: aminotransferase class V-fold PLP-dependent enzyme [Bacteroidetes bacterium]|nr:aminotransferase class V-fold PLP-dependent enzyme [Bacteroidota bacterium]
MKSKLERHFNHFRKNIVGIDQEFETPYGTKKMVYADWIASGRLYTLIEERIAKQIGPYIGNTHTETSETGTLMTKAYQYAHKLIKAHVNANNDDVIITAGFGMTAVVNKFQRILGLKSCCSFDDGECKEKVEKPVVFVTHMEHHSNHTSWLETYADVVLIPPDENNLVDPDELRKLIVRYRNRKRKIGAFTACSNVTGIIPDYYELASIMHENGGLAFIDFAGSAPYVDIDMHPEDPLKQLDAIFFSPHKFLGGPGSSGVLIFNKNLYKRPVPDNPGGGTVEWTNPWGGHQYIEDIELREDGGTPGFLQAIRAALTIEVKKQMDTRLMKQREQELVKQALDGFGKINGLHILAGHIKDRLGIFSFWFENVHFNLIVKLLNDRYGIQVRGGCACAGTYGHFLLNVTPEKSEHIIKLIREGDLSEKPGFVRISLHPTMTDEELAFIINAVKEIGENHEDWAKDYDYDPHNNEFYHKKEPKDKTPRIVQWFNLS